jgi:hypothetical protein
MIRWMWSKVMKWGWDFNHDLRSNSFELAEATPRKGRGGLHSISSNRRVEHNYDDETVITFKVYGANGGKIVETSRYDDKKDTEGIRRYVIDENADLAESLGKIVTMEYLR